MILKIFCRCSSCTVLTRILVGGVAGAKPPNQPQPCILTDYFNNYNFSKLKW